MSSGLPVPEAWHGRVRGAGSRWPDGAGGLATAGPGRGYGSGVAVEVRQPPPEDFERHLRTVATVFGHELEEADIERTRRVADFERALAAYDGTEIVGTAVALAFELAVPGGSVPAGGVTAVTVLPTHRRRGILTQMMRRQLDALRERGEPVAILWASEGAIYGRYGYGLATVNARLDADRGVPWVDGPETGRLRLVDREEAAGLFPAVYERVRCETPGFFARSSDWWEARTLADIPWQRRGGGPAFRAVLEVDGRPEGYAIYRIKPQSAAGIPGSSLLVQEAHGTGPEATRAVWRFLFGIDLVQRVTARLLAPDHPLRLLVSEPSRLRISHGDGLWLRLVDVAKALVARGYAAEGALELELSDGFCPWNSGVWRLEATSDGAHARRVGDPHLRLGAGELASAYLGGFSFAELARAGRIAELRPGGVALADSLFRTDRAPWCPETF
jgi:predicted acetyltransferase